MRGDAVKSAHPAVRDAKGRMRRPIGIRALLEWAFADECASIDFEDRGRIAPFSSSCSMEYRMLQQAELGCRIDGGGRSETDHDADLVAAAVASLPEGCGGRGMALRIADLARARRVPDAYVGVVQRCVPVGWHQKRHIGKKAATVHLCYVDERGPRKVRQYDVRVCPVTYHPSAGVIARARRDYLQWRLALLELRTTFRIRDDLSRWVLTQDLPPAAPWQDIS